MITLQQPTQPIDVKNLILSWDAIKVPKAGKFREILIQIN
jgi:hypothetical protein